LFDEGVSTVLLINPAANKFGGFLSRYVPVGIPVAIGYIAAYLEKHDIRCAVLDEEIIDITPSVLREKVEGLEKPYIFGLSCLTAHVGRGYQIAKMIRREFPESTIIFGGLHPTTQPEEALSTGVIDFVVRGEGEEIMLKLHQAIRGGSTDYTNMLGVSYIQNDVIINNPEAPLIPDINMIPPFPYHLFENPKYDMGFLTSSRGCPYRCSYCSQRLLTGTTYRYKNADYIVDELDKVIGHYGQNAVVFYDDNFCLKSKRVHELCDKIVDRGLHVNSELSVQTRADNVVEHGGEELVRHMAESGFTHMGFGLETGIQRLADLSRKDETVEIHLEAKDLCEKYGMDVSFFMIFGFPTETAEDRKETFELVRDSGVVATKYNNMIPYPGTPLYNELKESNRVVVTENWANFDSVLAMTTSIFDKTPLPYVPETCSEWELKRDIIKYNLKSYVNFKSLAGIFGHTKGIGWFMLPRGWYYKPRELFEMSKIATYLMTNIIMTSLPLWLTEPFMCLLNPNLKKRKRIKDYDPNSYVQIDWDRMQTKNKAVLLSKARKQVQATGAFSVLMEEFEKEKMASAKTENKINA
jgi:anaerobic magnesium-protoporphyrin IX monomethyl ester cyclase